MKKTWRFGTLQGDAADVMRSASSLGAAATRLGVDKSTVFRWVKSGKVPPPGGRRRAVSTGGNHPPGELSPEGWAASVRNSYALSPTEAELVGMAAVALEMAHDTGARPETRLAAMGRFQRLTRQLDLETETDGEAENDHRPTPRRIG